jgi:hypothetical protein
VDVGGEVLPAEEVVQEVAEVDSSVVEGEEVPQEEDSGVEDSGVEEGEVVVAGEDLEELAVVEGEAVEASEAHNGGIHLVFSCLMYIFNFRITSYLYSATTLVLRPPPCRPSLADIRYAGSTSICPRIEPSLCGLWKNGNHTFLTFRLVNNKDSRTEHQATKFSVFTEKYAYTPSSFHYPHPRISIS